MRPVVTRACRRPPLFFVNGHADQAPLRRRSGRRHMLRVDLWQRQRWLLPGGRSGGSWADERRSGRAREKTSSGPGVLARVAVRTVGQRPTCVRRPLLVRGLSVILTLGVLQRLPHLARKAAAEPRPTRPRRALPDWRRIRPSDWPRRPSHAKSNDYAGCWTAGTCCVRGGANPRPGAWLTRPSQGGVGWASVWRASQAAMPVPRGTNY